MINEVDEDNNGTMEFSEFLRLMTQKVKDMTKDEEIQEAFNVLDKEGDGYITVKELKYFMRKVAHIKLSSEEALEMIRYASSSAKKDMVSLEDFKHMIAIPEIAGGAGVSDEEEEEEEEDED